MLHYVRLLVIAFIGLLLMSPAPTVAMSEEADPRDGSAGKNTGSFFDASTAGQIVGTVQCFDGSIPDRATVYIPGLSVMARTNDTGEFQLFIVPEGTHALQVEVIGQERLPITDVSHISVANQSMTDVGTVQLACPEVCDGVDNNGNAQIDEGLECGEISGIGNGGGIGRGGPGVAFICSSQGLTQCGKACIDTSFDPDNCGACGNICSASEVCFSANCVPPLVR
jgi:hypothetical protein